MTATTARSHPTVIVDAGPSTLPEQRLRLVPRRVWLPRAAEAPAACGWYDSSRELRQGLAVREWDADTAPIPLEWFGLVGAGKPPGGGHPAQRAGAL